MKWQVKAHIYTKKEIDVHIIEIDIQKCFQHTIQYGCGEDLSELAH